MPNPSFSKDSCLTHSWNENHIFLKGISLKVNVTAQLEFELAYSDFTVQHFNRYTTRTTPRISLSMK